MERANGGGYAPEYPHLQVELEDRIHAANVALEYDNLDHKGESETEDDEEESHLPERLRALAEEEQQREGQQEERQRGRRPTEQQESEAEEHADQYARQAELGRPRRTH